jgi:hypothetical protein
MVEVDLIMNKKWVYLSIALFAAGVVWVAMYYFQNDPAEEPGRTV